MKKTACLLICIFCGFIGSYGQDDDIYFVPSKEKSEVREKSIYRSEISPIENREETDNWAAGRGNGSWDVDSYNRRGKSKTETVCMDSVEVEDAGWEEGGTYTARLVRFHSPRIGVYVSSPYYVDYCDIWWYDPWIYSPWYDGWYGWGWHPYAWGGWWAGWHAPWFGWGPAWGWHPHHGPSWGRPSYAYRGPGNRYNGSHRGGLAATRPSSRYFTGTNGTRHGGMTTRTTSSRNFTNSRGNSSRSFGNSSSRPSRNVSTNPTTRTSRGQSSGTSRPSSNYTPSRSFGNSSGSSYSSPSRSGSGHSSGTVGGGRSFGGGRGGRR